MSSDADRRQIMADIHANVWLGRLWDLGDTAGGQALADHFVDHRPIDLFPNTKQGHIDMALDWHQAFPDCRFEVAEVVVEGDLLVGRYRAVGTHLGVFMGMAPTGRKVELTGIDILRFSDQVITDWWHNEDFDEFVKQLTN